ncbi:MAG TPA: DUF4157 domain-containing protein [Blastocatellia bacterium]|nr:DUF4157 domain-containing protein [Blastocatellia bacterium]
MATTGQKLDEKQQTPAFVAPLLGSPSLVLRKCACGGAAGISGDCAECSQQRLSLKSTISMPGDELELEADRIASQFVSSSRGIANGLQASAPLSTSPAARSAPSNGEIYRQASSAKGDGGPTATYGQGGNQPAASQEVRPSSGLIVDDGSKEVATGQMRKSQFLDELRTSVCAAADAELASAGRSTKGCPYIEKWIGHYRTKDSAYVERSLHKFAPEAGGIKSARDYIPIVTNRIRHSVSIWAKTGEITGVPDELKSQIPGGGVLGALGGLASGVANAVGGLLSGIGSAISGVATGIGKALSSIGSLFFKSRDGGQVEADPARIRSNLGPGQPLDTGLKYRMETAFGHDFSRVRVHNDPTAAELSSNMNAKAFTLGDHVAFGGGEYRPGTLVGDALIAHELAHVVQQGESRTQSGLNKKGEGEDSSLEEDADRSAVGAVASMWAGGKGTLMGLGSTVMPRLKSGLGLRRCGAEGTEAQTAKQPVAEQQGGELVSMPELRDILKKMWQASIQDPLNLAEYSLTIVADASTGKVKRLYSQKNPVQIGQGGIVNICLPLTGSDALQPGERVLGTIHTHPIPASETPEEPNAGDTGTVCQIDRAGDHARCGSKHYIIGKERVYRFDCSGFSVVGTRKGVVGE